MKKVLWERQNQKLKKQKLKKLMTQQIMKKS